MFYLFCVNQLAILSGNKKPKQYSKALEISINLTITKVIGVKGIAASKSAPIVKDINAINILI